MLKVNYTQRTIAWGDNGPLALSREGLVMDKITHQLPDQSQSYISASLIYGCTINKGLWDGPPSTYQQKSHHTTITEPYLGTDVFKCKYNRV